MTILAPEIEPQDSLVRRALKLAVEALGFLASRIEAQRVRVCASDCFAALLCASVTIDRARADRPRQHKGVSMESFIGQICLFPFNFAPTNWLPCTGQLMPINQNQALFSLLGTNFGGDGMTTFGLPNLQGKAPAPNLQYFIAMNGIYPSRP